MAYYGFCKDERLCRKSLIDGLYEHGVRFTSYPYKVCFQIVRRGTIPREAQLLIVAPKRNLHFAVQRNRVKRLTRECYRKRKHQLYEVLNRGDRQMLLSLYYIDKQILDYDLLSSKFDKLMSKLTNMIEENIISVPEQ